MMTERVKMRYVSCPSCGKQLFKVAGNCSVEITSWILGNVTRIPRHELPQTLDFSYFLPLFT